jgi:Rps23 Pro-64 3,4-dihydroxylase Tpa1-like proline 4-hydroxylase
MDDAHMTQSNLATVSPFQSDHAVIDGRTLLFDQILNAAFFTPRKIAELNETFNNNKPFPHLVIENLFSPVLLEMIYNDFDNLKRNELRAYNNSNEKKYASMPYATLGNASELYFNTIHSTKFITFLEEVTGIEGLITDPSRSGGGLHQIPTGGKFAVHVDFNKHSLTKLDNRLVFITYLNKDWLPAYGGALELWNADEEKCEVEVDPVFGRSILFAHTPKSLHGHPTPVNAPNGRPRRSVATYYYSNGRSDSESAGIHTTIFFKRRKAERNEKIAASIKYFTPPIVVDGIQKLKALWRKKR